MYNKKELGAVEKKGRRVLYVRSMIFLICLSSIMLLFNMHSISPDLFTSFYLTRSSQATGTELPMTCDMKVPIDKFKWDRLWTGNRERILAQFSNLTRVPPYYNRTEAIVIVGRQFSVGNEGVSFIQDSDFMFMSGVTIPGAALILPVNVSDSTGFLASLAQHDTAILVLPEKSDSQLAFDGGYPGPSYFSKNHGIRKVIVTNDLSSLLIGRYQRVHTPKQYKFLDERIVQTQELLPAALRAARRHKSKLEIKVMKMSALVAANAHRKVLEMVSSSKHSSNGASEYTLLSLFQHMTFICGARVQAYSPIAAAKSHASVLHYQGMDEEDGLRLISRRGRRRFSSLKKKASKGSLFLLDAAGSFMGYASDITRTIPVGKWPVYGKEIYRLVLKANQLGISMVVPTVHWKAISREVDLCLLEGLLELGLVHGSIDELEKSGVVRTFMPHGLGHTVGIDVHDVQPAVWQLEVGDILTIEPGIYFNKDIFDLARNKPQKNEFIQWHLVDQLIAAEFGGVRIEDVVEVTDIGHEVLSSHAPKLLKDIEEIAFY